MIKAIFFDYSNILARDNQDMKKETKEALKVLMENNILVGVISGLPSSFVWAKGIEVGFHFYGGENGAEGFSPTYGFSIISGRKNINVMENLASSIEDKYGKLIWWQPNKYVKTVKPRPTTTFRQLKKIYKFVDGKIKNLKIDFKVYFHEDAIDIVPAGVLKSSLIKKFLSKIKAMNICEIRDEEVAVVGDSSADIEMLQKFGYPATTSNADRKVKKIVKMKGGFISKKPHDKGAIDIINWTLRLINQSKEYH